MFNMLCPKFEYSRRDPLLQNKMAEKWLTHASLFVIIIGCSVHCSRFSECIRRCDMSNRKFHGQLSR